MMDNEEKFWKEAEKTQDKCLRCPYRLVSPKGCPDDCEVKQKILQEEICEIFRIPCRKEKCPLYATIWCPITIRTIEKWEKKLAAKDVVTEDGK